MKYSAEKLNYFARLYCRAKVRIRNEFTVIRDAVNSKNGGTCRTQQETLRTSASAWNSAEATLCRTVSCKASRSRHLEALNLFEVSRTPLRYGVVLAYLPLSSTQRSWFSLNKRLRLSEPSSACQVCEFPCRTCNFFAACVGRSLLLRF